MTAVTVNAERAALALAGFAGLAAAAFAATALMSGGAGSASGVPALRFALPPAVAPGKAPIPTASDVVSPAAGGQPLAALDAPTAEGLAPVAVPVPQGTPGPTAPGRMMALDFDLTRYGRPPAPDRPGIATTSMKTVRFEAKPVGRIEILVSEDAVIFVPAQDMARLLAADRILADRIAAAPAALVSLAQLRDLGLSVRYDPIADAIDMRPAG